uniref:GSKIP domain-containing protein n=1 Tax=Meloidogyne incognita TaxID=6306 RepID=A0A914NIQ2_MELIC
MDMGNKCDNNRPHLDKKSPPSSISTMSGPSSPTPSISCETCTQLSQLEVEAFAAVGEVATFVKSISVSEILTRTPELLFLNLVTLENESYCIELTQKGWRICSDRLDCMYGDFRKVFLAFKFFLFDNLFFSGTCFLRSGKKVFPWGFFREGAKEEIFFNFGRPQEKKFTFFDIILSPNFFPFPHFEG